MVIIRLSTRNTTAGVAESARYRKPYTCEPTAWSEGNSQEDSFGAVNFLKEKGEVTMTERMIENRVKKLSALEEQIAQLQRQADAIKGELKADLEEKGMEELKTKNFLIRWKEIMQLSLF